VDVVYGAADHIDAADRVLEPYPVEPWNFERLKETQLHLPAGRVLAPPRVLDRHGVLDSSLRYCMDYEYWLRLGRNGRAFAHVPEKTRRVAPASRHQDAWGERLPCTPRSTTC
jgi:hypothetical protein